MPAAAMKTSTPRAEAVRTKSRTRSGFRCAEACSISWATPNDWSSFAASSIVARSDSLPNRIETRGLAFIGEGSGGEGRERDILPILHSLELNPGDSVVGGRPRSVDRLGIGCDPDD